MITKRVRNVLTMLTTVMAFIFAAGTAMAAVSEFDAETFQKAQQGDRTIALVFHADWCPTCRKQLSAIEVIASSDKEFAKVVFLRVNFDTSNDLKKQFKVTSQSTVVVLKGLREVARGVGTTDIEVLRGMLRRGL